MADSNVKKPKITIVDDNRDHIKLLKYLLEANNFSVTTAYDGVNGLRVIRREKPNLVILDVMMPGDLDGRDVLVELRKDKDLKDVPVIMLTARSSSLEKDYGLNLGASLYLEKPYDEDELLKAIKNIIDKKS